MQLVESGILQLFVLVSISFEFSFRRMILRSTVRFVIHFCIACSVPFGERLPMSEARENTFHFMPIYYSVFIVWNLVSGWSKHAFSQATI
jgi:hypothetical protein